jgi:aspartate carbamoyltransferase regulatory subunit
MLRSDLVSEKNFDLGNLFKFDEASTASPSATFIFVKNKNVSDKMSTRSIFELEPSFWCQNLRLDLLISDLVPEKI